MGNINMKVLAIFALFLAAASASPQWAGPGIAQLGYVANAAGCSTAQVSACNLHFSRYPGTTPEECGNLCALCDLCDAVEISAPRPAASTAPPTACRPAHVASRSAHHAASDTEHWMENHLHCTVIIAHSKFQPKLLCVT